MIIHSKFKDYELTIDQNIGSVKTLVNTVNAGFIIDSNVYDLYYDMFKDIPKDRLFIVNAVEDKKTADTALEICEMMTNIPAKRNSHLISVGGGIIQDITGFAANILYRGIHWTFIPTTLLAACDSCIGGKTSLNYKKYKNLLGTFYPPDRIYIYPEFFKTLSDRDFKSGLGEVIKFNIMRGNDGLQNIENNIDKLLARDNICLNKFVNTSLDFKKNFIEIDEFDRGERVKLNFAHTFGHAIETVTKYEIPHGTAVAIGMIMANYIALQRGFLTADFTTHCEKILLRVIDINANVLRVPYEKFIDAMKKDKKQLDENLTAVLMSDNGKDLIIVHDITNNEVKITLNYFIDMYENKTGG